MQGMGHRERSASEWNGVRRDGKPHHAFKEKGGHARSRTAREWEVEGILMPGCGGSASGT